MKLMIVDDSPSMLKVIRTILKGLGYDDISEAKNGAEALEKLSAGGYDLLITDWNMPEMSGLELVEHLRANPVTAALPIIMSTSRNVKEDVIAAMRAGVNNYISKPFNPAQLQEKIDRVLKSSRSAGASARLDALVNGAAKITLQDTFPFAVFVEHTVDPDKLGRPENAAIVDYLSTAVGALNRINQQFPEAQVRYALADSTHDVMRLVRFHRDHLKLLLIANDSGGVTLARLAALNHGADYKVCLICELASEFSAAQRDSLEKLGILLLVRRQVDGRVLEELFKEYAVAATRERPAAEAIAPEQLQQRLETDISLTTELPVLPQVYNRIARLSRDPSSSMADWAAAVETDPLSAAMVLRRARSPIYGFRDQVEDVQRAVTLIGKDAVKDIVASAALKSSLDGIGDKHFRIEDFWRHSAAVGMVARMLVLPLDSAERDSDQQRLFEEWHPDDVALNLLGSLNLAARFALAEGEDPFVGGMMHDIGKVAMTCAYPGLLALVLEGIQQAQGRIPMREAEAQLTAVADHSHVGAILARSWELSPPLLRVVECHHRPAATDAYARLICLADFVGGAIHPFPGDAVFPHVLHLQRLLKLGLHQTELSDGDRQALEEKFLPPDLLDSLGLDMDNALTLTALLAPGVQKLTLGMLRNLGDN